jgi:hypothetical protein
MAVFRQIGAQLASSHRTTPGEDPSMTKSVEEVARTLPASYPVAVVMECRPSTSPWQTEQWEAVDGRLAVHALPRRVTGHPVPLLPG